jgi:ligand-binding sensor protein
MADDGRLPAIKVGKQWRFPADQLQQSLGSQIEVLKQPDGQENEETETDVDHSIDTNLANLLPIECVQLIQDSHANLLGVMLIVTDLNGNPITKPSNPCGLFSAISDQPDAIKRCISSWHDLGRSLNIEPEFHISHLGLQCARGLIRVGRELTGMVVAGCIAPQNWPPTNKQLNSMSAELNVEPRILAGRLDQVYILNEDQQTKVLSSVQKIANIIAHIVQERLMLLARVDGIANPTGKEQIVI